MNALNQSFYELSNIDNESCVSSISSYDDNSYNGGNMNNDQNEDGEQYLELNDDNYEFVQFKENVKEWLNIDDDIITLQNAIKDRKKRKNDLTPKIMSFMDEYKINDLTYLLNFTSNAFKIFYNLKFQLSYIIYFLILF